MLDRFRLDPRTTVSVWSAYQPMCVPAHPRDPIHRLEDLIPRDPICFPITETATTLCLPSAPSHNMRFIATNSGDPDHGFLTVDLVHDCFSPEDLGSDCDCADVQLEAILTIFSGASLQELELGSDAFSVSELSDDLRSLLPNLQTLDVSFTDPNSLEQIFEVLTSLPDPIDLESEALSDLVLPELRTLRMKTFEWSPQLLEDIAKHLEWRSQRGTKLSQLHIEVYGRPKDEDGGIGRDSQHNAQLARLQMVVNGPVEYVDVPSARGKRTIPPIRANLAPNESCLSASTTGPTRSSSPSYVV
ncbi:hypothetical protein NUW54_g2799 [Trametes sanguinea]|uniref:Uncharacterized protein n=1 Tax=Trametes sanguinea TaxID=158606 RepID=A0ACC1Q5P6_9APHY|nr:hypothetical protein NUW54_g2799 [Trametes sanguinea]